METYRRYAATGTEQAREGVFPQVVFLTTTAPRVELLTDVVRALLPDVRRLFAVGLVCQVDSRLVGDEVPS